MPEATNPHPNPPPLAGEGTTRNVPRHLPPPLSGEDGGGA
jgi:hypothetical protein